MENSPKTYLIETDKKKLDHDAKKDLIKVKSSSDVNVKKEFETDRKVVTVIEVDNIERVNGLRNKEGVLIEENQRLKSANLDSSFTNSFKSLFYNFFFRKANLNTQSFTNTEFVDVDLSKYKIYDDSTNYQINSKTWNIPFIKSTDAWKYGHNGDGSVIAILDTGILPHECMMGNILPGLNFVGEGDPSQDTKDVQTHGEHVSSIASASNVSNLIESIFGVAPRSKILPCKVLGDDGYGDLSDIIEGFVYATSQGVDVINMSLGGGNASEIFRNAIKEAISKNVFIVAASGNENSSVSYPAKYPEIFAVASVSKNRKISWFSNYGDEVSCCAPGDQIYGATGINEYTYKSGTSQACPHVAGAAAILKQIDREKITTDIIKESLEKGAVEIIGVEKQKQGNGILNLPNSIIQANKILQSKYKVPKNEPERTAYFYKGCRGEIILDIQKQLNKIGLYNGALDGIYGNVSANAIKEFSNGEKDFVDYSIYNKLTNNEWPDIFERALQLTAAFEGTGYSRIVGNSGTADDAILTWGIIGFTIKYRGIQDILVKIYESFSDLINYSFQGLSPEIFKQIEYYKETGKNDKFIEWGLNVQTNRIVHAPIRKAFQTLGEDKRCQNIQKEMAKNNYWIRANQIADEFELSEDLSLAQLFDCVVQGFSNKAKDIALKHIESGNPANGNSPWNEKEKRKIIAQADAQTSKIEFQNDTWQRKSLFITGEDENIVFSRLPQDDDQIGAKDVHGRKYKLIDWGFEV